MSSTATARVTWSPPPVPQLTGTLLNRGAALKPCVAYEPTCTCGQALDCSHSAHCPRCGVTLRR